MIQPHDELEQLSAYVDGELEAAAATRVEQHLAGCASCREVESAVRATLVDVRALPEAEPSEQDRWALRAAITRARTTDRRFGARWQRWALGSGAAAAMLALIVSVAVINGGDGSRQDTAAGGPEAAADAFTTGGVPVEVLDASFSAEDARAMLDQPQAAMNGLAAEDAAPATRSIDDGTPAELSAPTEQITRCEAALFEGDPTLRRPVRYVSARYNDVPAFFLVYEIADPARVELWVVAQNACENVLFFAQNDA